MREETRGRKVEVYPLVAGHNLLDRLKHIRTSTGMNQSNMASKLGLPFRTYCKIEAGERELKASEISTVLEHCGIDANWFLFGTGAQHRQR